MWLFQKGRRSGGTERVYRTEIKEFLSVVIKPLRQITVEDMARYQESLETGRGRKNGRGLSVASRARALSTVRSLFSFARKIGYLQFNVTEVLDVPVVPVSSDGHFLTLAEAQLIINASRVNLRDYAVIALLLKTGLRVGELAKAIWSNLYEDASGNIGLKVVGKGSKARTVKITSDVWNILKELHGGKDIDVECEEPLIPNKTRRADQQGRLSEVSIRNILRDYAKSAELNKKPSPHWLRHTHATLAILGGATISQVREGLGHGDIRTTQRYEHSAKALQNTSADFIGIVC